MELTLEQAVGQNVARFRQRKDWNQAELGKMLGDVTGKAWQRQSVWAAERGKRAFSAVDLIGLASALDVSVQDLLRVEEPVTAGDTEISPEGVLKLISGDSDTRQYTEMFHTAADVQNVTRQNEHLYWNLVLNIRQAASQNDKLREEIQNQLERSISLQKQHAQRDAENDGEDVSTPVKLEEYMRRWGHFDVPIIKTARDVLERINDGEDQ